MLLVLLLSTRLGAHASSAAPPSGPQSWLTRTTLLTIYGRAFNTAPILGRLGFDKGFADLQTQVRPFIQAIRPNNRGHRIVVAVHLIYAIANPCGGSGNCLGYLDDTGVNIVNTYIKPAAQRGWLVILDDQLGRSWPAREVQHIIAKGYLAYDNVEVALDPEFRAAQDQAVPGIPVGAVGAGELNRAQWFLNHYAAVHHLPHKKILIVHEFQSGMIRNRASLSHAFPYVDPVVTADGFGDPLTKAQVYDALLGPGASAGIVWRGLKLFYPNPYEQAGHADNPVLDWRLVFGWSPAIAPNGRRYFFRPPPDVIIIA